MITVQTNILRYATFHLVLQACYSAVLPTLCGSAQFTCSDGSCIPLAWMCDGSSDCPAGRDELTNCTSCSGPDEFECSNKQCITKQRACDGIVDCYDKSDENNCTKETENHVICGAEEFLCANGTCLPTHKLCNKEKDCEDSSDEGGRCELLECSKSNGGCSHQCQNTPRGPLCGCPPGFVKGPDRKTCKDLDECKDGVDLCSQICTNTIGSYKCACVEGYHVTMNGRGCIAKEYSLLFMVGQRLFVLDSKDREPSVLLAVPGDGGGMDYDFNDKKLYWADNIRKVIYTAPIHGSWDDMTVVIRGTGRVDGIAVDWIGRHLYWTDDDKDIIAVATLSGELRTTLIRTGLDKPRDIVLDPINSYMYWTDWGMIAKIERSHMDGSNRAVLVSSEISWPNGLALDLPNKRLYWTDGKREKIESIRLNGSSRRSFDLGQRSHPFSVAVFGDHVFWTDGLSSSLEKADKRNGQNRVVLLHTKNRLSNVRILHPLIKTTIPNPCGNSKCQYLCLLSPHNHSCACPDSVNSTACSQAVNAKLERRKTTATYQFFSTRSGILPKPTRRIFWNKTNRKSLKTNKKISPSERLSSGNESQTRNATRDVILCLEEMCKVMKVCVPHEVLRNHTTLSHLAREMGNCTCVELMEGTCGNLIRRSKKPKLPAHGFNVHWMLFFIVSLVLMVLFVFIVIIWLKIQEKIAARPRVVYNKHSQRIQMTNLPTPDYDDDDYDDDDDTSSIPSGYENPVYISSTSGLPGSTSGHLVSAYQLTSSKESNEDEICPIKFSSRSDRARVNAKIQNETDINSNDRHQFVNPVYFSPEI